MRTFTLLIGLLLCFIQGVYAENIPDENSQATDSISDQALKEVVVEHQTVKRSAQGDLITITKDMRLGTRNTGELLGNIPGGMYNSINRALTFYGSSNIIVLVDSIEHDFSYITRMNQNRFDKINITYNPTGKYRGYDAVINLKTRPHYKGYDGTVSLDGAIYTGNRNGNSNALGSESAAGQFTYTYDKINVGGQLNNSWSKEGSTSYSEDYYPLNGIRQTVLHTPRNHPATVSIDRNTSANAFIDYHIDDNNVIAASYFFRFGDSDSDTRYRLQVEDYNRNTTSINELHSKSHTHNSLSHNAVAYYWGNVRNWRLHGYASYNSNSHDSYNITTRNKFEVTDNRHVTTDKVWGGGQVSRSFGNNEWTASASYFYNRNSHNQYALADNRKLAHSVDINQFPELNLYFNPDGSPWSLSLSGGVQLYQNSADGKTYRDANPWGGLQVSFNPSSKLSLRFNYRSGNMQPILSQIENYGAFTDSLEYRCGNPALKPGFMHMLSLYTNINRIISFKLWANITPTDMRTFASTGYGLRPDGIDGPFVRYDWVNSRRSEWGLTASFNRIFFNAFQVNCSAGFTQYYQRYKDSSNRRTYAFGSMFLKYFNQPKEITAALMYDLGGNSGVTPQSVNYGYYDSLAILIAKEFRSQWGIQLSYYLPVHFTKCERTTVFTSEPLVGRAWNNNALRSDNSFVLSVYYQFSGGNKVRSFNHYER